MENEKFEEITEAPETNKEETPRPTQEAPPKKSGSLFVLLLIAIKSCRRRIRVLEDGEAKKRLYPDLSRSYPSS